MAKASINPENHTITNKAHVSCLGLRSTSFSYSNPALKRLRSLFIIHDHEGVAAGLYAFSVYVAVPSSLKRRNTKLLINNTMYVN